MKGIDDVDHFFGEGDDNSSTAPARKPLSPLDVIERWRKEGPLVRVPTGIRPLDELCRGGLPIPWRMFIIGAPSAGKTFVATVIANTIARRLESEGVCVGILAVDEEADDCTVRLMQMAGFTVAQAEQRDPEVLDYMSDAIGSLNVHFYDHNYPIEAAASDLADKAKAQKRKAALFIDSIHAARSIAAIELDTDSIRQVIEANVQAVREVSTKHRMLVVGTAEANRAAYRTEDAANLVNDLASGAESRAIEFGGQTLLMLRTPKDHHDVAHVRVPKNRRARDGEFWLRLDRERHTVSECGDPHADPAQATAREDQKRIKNKLGVEKDAEAVAAIVRANPGIGEVDLRAALRAAGQPLGVERYMAAKRLFTRPEGFRGERLVDRSEGRGCKWHLEQVR